MDSAIKIASRTALLGGALAAAGILAGCAPGVEPGFHRYEVTVTNLTNAQPLTPPAVVLHRKGYTPWVLGEPAADGLERLAESGDPSDFVADAEADPHVASTAVAGGGVAPGASRTLEVGPGLSTGLRLSLATMLAGTNDGFAGTDGFLLSELGAEGRKVLLVPALDAGTEADTETQASVPALGGEGWNPVRDDSADFVAVHAGVVTSDDGLASSDLDESYRFKGPVARIEIRRLP